MRLLCCSALLAAACAFAISAYGHAGRGAGAVAETRLFFAALAHDRLANACARLGPGARRALDEHGGCIPRLGVLRSALMGPTGAAGSLSPRELVTRTKTDLTWVSADGRTARVLVPPCLGTFVLERSNTSGWRLTRLPFA